MEPPNSKMRKVNGKDSYAASHPYDESLDYNVVCLWKHLNLSSQHHKLI